MMQDPPSHADNAEKDDEFTSVNAIILTSSLLVLITIGYYINTHRIKNLPESGAAIALGFAVGIATRVLGMTQEEQLLDPNGDFGEFFFFVLLPPIIFEAGLSLQTSMFVDNLGAILTFAVAGTVVSAIVVSAGMRLAAATGLFGLAAHHDNITIFCHLFGALISATDPVATIALFGGARFKADPLLHSLINGESVLNDAVALVLFVTLSHHVGRQEVPSLISVDVLGHFMLVLGGSVIIGLLAGALLSVCFIQARALSVFPDYEISAILLGAYLTYALTQLLGLSGISALFFFGIVLSNYNWYNLSEASKVASKVTFGTLAKLCEACVFIYLGVVAALSFGRFHWHLGLVVYSLVLITVARAAHIFPFAALLNWCGRQRQISKNMKVMMWISGLRGAIAFAMSLRIPCADGSQRGSTECRNSDLLVTTTISIVISTTLVVGTAMERVAMVLGVIEPGVPVGHSASSASDQQLHGLSVPLATSSDCSVQDRGEASVGTSTARADVGADDVGRLPVLEGGLHDSLHAPPEHGGGPEPPALVGHGVRSFARSFDSLRFWGRGHLYQAFARFDLNVLQPRLGGPCRMRLADGDGEGYELAARGDPQGSFTRLLAPPSEEDAPTWSRSVVFE